MTEFKPGDRVRLVRAGCVGTVLAVHVDGEHVGLWVLMTNRRWPTTWDARSVDLVPPDPTEALIAAAYAWAEALRAGRVPLDLDRALAKAVKAHREAQS